MVLTCVMMISRGYSSCASVFCVFFQWQYVFVFIFSSTNFRHFSIDELKVYTEEELMNMALNKAFEVWSILLCIALCIIV